jgi:predicted TIM-barrel fold metal-dependent hydrolase
MTIIDAHAHVVEHIAGFGRRGEMRPLGEGRVRWGDGTELQLIPSELGDREFLAPTLVGLMDSHQVEKAVLLHGSFYGFQNEYAVEASRTYPGRFAAAGTFDPYCLDREALCRRLLHEFGLKILKFEVSSRAGLMSYHQPFELDGPVMEGIWSAMAEAGATLVLDIGSPGMASFQPDAVARVARRFPSLRVVMCHLLAPTLKDGPALAEALDTLALDNVWFDLAAVPWNVAPEPYPYPTGCEFVLMAKKRLGSGKLMWGSDVPCVLTRETYPRLVDYLLCGEVFTGSEVDAVYRSNALEVFGSAFS